MEKKREYTLDDIAKELGISKTTVSRAISGKGRIGKETRERVHRFIEEHDYRPNVLARGLAQKKTFNISLVLPTDYAMTEEPFFKECMTGICEMASEYNYDILLAMEDGENVSQLERQIGNRKVDGMILSRSMIHSPAQKLLTENEIPFVLIGPAGDPQVASIDNRNREACRELTNIMLMKGMRRLVLLGGDRANQVNQSRLQGFQDACQERGIPMERTQVVWGVDSYQMASRAVDWTGYWSPVRTA